MVMPTCRKNLNIVFHAVFIRNKFRQIVALKIFSKVICHFSYYSMCFTFDIASALYKLTEYSSSPSSVFSDQHIFFVILLVVFLCWICGFCFLTILFPPFLCGYVVVPFASLWASSIVLHPVSHMFLSYPSFSFSFHLFYSKQNCCLSVTCIVLPLCSCVGC